MHSNFVALRLCPGDELKRGIVEFCEARKLKSAFVVTCVGSVDACTLRLANADPATPNTVRDYNERFEIVGCVGTICADGAHLHVSLADKNGTCVGGHLIGARIFTTAEIVLGNCTSQNFSRVYDAATGFDELNVTTPPSLVEALPAGFRWLWWPDDISLLSWSHAMWKFGVTLSMVALALMLL